MFFGAEKFAFNLIPITVHICSYSHMLSDILFCLFIYSGESLSVLSIIFEVPRRQLLLFALKIYLSHCLSVKKMLLI